MPAGWIAARASVGRAPLPAEGPGPFVERREIELAEGGGAEHELDRTLIRRLNCPAVTAVMTMAPDASSRAEAAPAAEALRCLKRVP